METSKPRRARIKAHCKILGLIQDKVLDSGIYIRDKNLESELFDKLISPEFAHAVEVLTDEPEPEPLGTVEEGPKETFGYAYSRRRQHEAELEQWERVHGRTHPPDEIEGERYK